MRNNPITIDGKIFIACEVFDGWCVQVKAPGKRPVYAEYTPNGHKRQEAKGLTRKQAQKFLNILAGEATPADERFKVLS